MDLRELTYARAERGDVEREAWYDPRVGKWRRSETRRWEASRYPFVASLAACAEAEARAWVSELAEALPSCACAGGVPCAACEAAEAAALVSRAIDAQGRARGLAPRTCSFCPAVGAPDLCVDCGRPVDEHVLESSDPGVSAG